MSEFKKKFEAAILLKQKAWGISFSLVSDQVVSSENYKGQKITYSEKKYSDGSSGFTYVIGSTSISAQGLRTIAQAKSSAHKHVDDWEDDIKDGSVKFSGVALASPGELKNGDRVVALDNLREGRVKKGDQGVVVDADYAQNFVDVKFNGKVETMNVNQVRKV